ncbi:hypothetical protein A6R68_15997 [Neotoma lepida]|uniref:RRM domain-containing protein n=1 Tax=Neotoma lepida TaxID=56216 RepID=A0A1A6H6J5_NEOLE|nr:hypothetical protein A6R68_15997 [Neotoma lepida]
MISASSYASTGLPHTFAIPQAAGFAIPEVSRALDPLAVPEVAVAAAAAAAESQVITSGSPDVVNAVLLVANLNPEKVTPQSLFILFGAYDNVQRNQSVQLPREGKEDQDLTKDYANSPLYRFKKPGSKNFQNIFLPAATLHLSNLPTSVLEEDLKKLFSSSGGSVKAFKFFPKDRKMAQIRMGLVEEAIQALVELHGHILDHSHYLRVSFSRMAI